MELLVKIVIGLVIPGLLGAITYLLKTRFEKQESILDKLVENQGFLTTEHSLLREQVKGHMKENIADFNLVRKEVDKHQTILESFQRTSKTHDIRISNLERLQKLLHPDSDITKVFDK
jgi:hypothetical protein